MSSLSIVIPVGPAEQKLGGLPADLIQALKSDRRLALQLQGWELILVFCEESLHLREQLAEQESATVLCAEAGRAKQMNAGVLAASGEFVWFLHLDSNVGLGHLWRLSERILQNADGLHYFPLAFEDDGAGPMRLNQWGANFRSVCLGVPFGDQAFCLLRESFLQLGGYPENVAYGEDHLLVWYARQAGMRLRSTGLALPTSARKYASHGWLSLTFKYQYLWLKQAWPEWMYLLRLRLFR
ncbi:hypothetical protein [Aliamphritea ceti]|uniref:hypothetical protein n=1 Tax=Aliamphritea ceti TaxID=1524258 RepID=UPI0021C3C33F|nr:hypothetical protein [Aliamphritea ceti]